MGRIGNYEIKGIIGRGGMGSVFRALDSALSRNVALKVLDPSLASIAAARKRFAMEARAMAAISHEHVVPVYTGHSPFRSESMYGSMQRIVHEQPRSIREQAPAIPDWLERFIFKLLLKKQLIVFRMR